MIIRIVLLVAILVVSAFLVRSTSNAKNVALRRLLLLGFVLIAFVTVIFPDLTTQAANWVGVGRGADLLLYLLVIAFLGYAVASFRRMNHFENRITDLSRELAIARSDPRLRPIEQVTADEPTGSSALPEDRDKGSVAPGQPGGE